MDLTALLDRMSIPELRELLEQVQKTLRRKQIDQVSVVYQPPASIPFEPAPLEQAGAAACCTPDGKCC